MRNKTIDAFRGFIMILMALDHASYFIINTHFYEGFDYVTPYPNALAMFTRVITHICAPGFFFALGYGVMKSNKRLKLITRGLFLIILQLTIINYAWDNDVVYFGVITALGLTLVFMGAVKPLVRKYGLIAGLSLITLSQLFMYTPWVHETHLFIRALFVPGIYENSYILYVLVPWLGLSFIGGYMAKYDTLPYLKLAGISLSIALIAFMTPFIKYPPSILFLGSTMAINFMIMYLIHRYPSKILVVYGQAALPFYVCHLYVYKIIGYYVESNSYMVLYILWLIGVILLFYPCKYARKIKNAIACIYKAQAL